MVDISVIIPVHNAACYLDHCVSSVLAQTYENFELILVDDGSSDGSGDICDRFAKTDNRVKVIHQSNKGVSEARNIGIRESSGRYITLIDSDDYVDTDYLKVLYANQSDVTLCNWFYEDYVTKNKTEVFHSDSFSLDLNDLVFLDLYEKELLYSTCGRLLKLSIILDNNLSFKNTLTRGEDTIFMFNYIEKCKNICFVNRCLYHYVKYGLEGSVSSRLNEMNVIALNTINQFIEDWLKKYGFVSKKFNSISYWTKSEQKQYFLRVYNDSSISWRERAQWYKLFFSLPNFYKNSKMFFINDSIKMKIFLRIKSSILLSGYQEITFRIRRRKRSDS